MWCKVTLFWMTAGGGFEWMRLQVFYNIHPIGWTLCGDVFLHYSSCLRPILNKTCRRNSMDEWNVCERNKDKLSMGAKTNKVRTRQTNRQKFWKFYKHINRQKDGQYATNIEMKFLLYEIYDTYYLYKKKTFKVKTYPFLNVI